MTKIENLINHVVFIIDKSGSMSGLEDSVVKVFDNQVKHLAKLSQQLNQETRISVFFFSSGVENIIFDKDVLRLPSLKGLYRPGGSTAMINATLKGVSDLKETSQRYGDHSFLIYVVTDGGETDNISSGPTLKKTIKSLPDNWTLGVLVPDQTCKFAAEKFGFPKNNISIWSTTKDGMDEIEDVIVKSTTQYMQNRSVGIRSCSNLFSINTANLKESVVKKNLKELKSSEYQIFPVTKKIAIKPFVESWTKDYISGSAYYELIKTEKIQRNKQIVVQNKLNGKVYGGAEGRKLLGLPDYEVKVNPIDHKDWIIYVQSSSVNRWLLPETNLLVMK